MLHRHPQDQRISAGAARHGRGHAGKVSWPCGRDFPASGRQQHPRGAVGPQRHGEFQAVSDIDQLAVGDTFYIHVLGEVLAYKADTINTVLPTDTSLLQIEDGKDLVTLVTCTPFAINTHRLLVRGHRVPYTPEQEASAAAENQPRPRGRGTTLPVWASVLAR